jgi:hypothetical protein
MKNSLKNWPLAISPELMSKLLPDQFQLHRGPGQGCQMAYFQTKNANWAINYFVFDVLAAIFGL